MKIDEALEWLNEIIKHSADCDRMSIDDERVQAIMVARDVLESIVGQKSKTEQAIEILKNIDWVGSGAKGMIQDAIESLEGAENDESRTNTR